MWTKLTEAGVDGKMMLTIRSMYNSVKSSVVVNARLTAWFDINIGLRQGCVLSPLLFLIFINDLIKEFNKSDSLFGVGNQHYVISERQVVDSHISNKDP